MLRRVFGDCLLSSNILKIMGSNILKIMGSIAVEG